jgi:hypothetical protein
MSRHGLNPGPSGRGARQGTRHQIRRAVHELATQAGDRMVTRQAVAGEPAFGTEQAPEPAAAIRIAMALQAEARRYCLDAIRRAREDGLTWTTAGEALGFADDPGPGMTSVAERAFHYAARDLGAGPSFTWRCPSCGGLVSDHGPEMGDPHDAERGHPDGCERFAGMVAAWEESWRDE